MDLFVAAMAVDAVGWVKLGYFHGVGYGLAMVAMSLLTIANNGVSLLAVGMAAFGARLGLYLYLRDMTYARDVSFFLRLVMWGSSSLIFWCMFYPVSFASPHHYERRSVLSLVGLFLFSLGLIVEALADAQKSQWKRLQPNLYIR